MKIVFDKDKNFIGISEESLGEGYIEKHVDMLPDEVYRCVWIGDFDSGKLVSIDSHDYAIFQSANDRYDGKVLVYESDLRRKATEKIERQGYDIYTQLNIMREAIKRLDFALQLPDHFCAMSEIIDNITSSYKIEKEKVISGDNFRYITIKEEKEMFPDIK